MSMKRKADAAALATASPAAKRSKIQGETSETTSKKGLEFLASLRDARDKAGRRIAATFEKLPDKKKDATWYEQVRLPLSLEMIQRKLDTQQYSTMTDLEGDLKRMIVNWKEVYDKNAEPWKDAEKVRKYISTRMKEQGLNPRYENEPGFVVPPTPLPTDDADADADEDGDAEADDSVDIDDPPKDTRKLGKIIFKRKNMEKAPEPKEATVETPPPGKLRLRLGRRSTAAAEEAAITDGEGTSAEAISTPPKRGGTRLILHRSSTSKPVEEQAPVATKPRRASASFKMPADASTGFNGKTMTEAQEKILEEMIQLEDEDGNSISQPFIFLPSRELKDYYAAIKHPLSIKGAQKLARGVRGRDKVTGFTLLKTWQEFEDEIAYIWKNAHTYNEDTSDICKLADQLEKFFKLRVEEAKKHVADPPQPKLKLNADKPAVASPAISQLANHVQGVTALTPARYAVDEEALRRQRAMVANGVNGGLKAQPSVQSAAASSGATTPAPKVTPSYAGYPQSNGASTQMQPPHTTPRPQPTITRPPPPPPSEDVKKPWDTWLRASRPEQFRWPYHTIKEILIISHPNLDLGERAYRWSLYPWREFNYASHVLPMHQEANRILLSPLLIKPTRERPTVYHFVTVNGVRQQISSSAPRIMGGQASEEDNLYRSVYDIQLKPDDVTEIMVECFTCPGEVCATNEVIFDKHVINIQPR